MKRVVVTGIGPVSSLGVGCAETWNSILDLNLNLVKETYSIDDEEWGEFYVHKIRDFDIKKFNLPTSNFEFIKELRTVVKEDVDLYYLLSVIKTAIEDSRLHYNPACNDIGLIITHENPGIEVFFEELMDSIYNVFRKRKRTSKLQLAKEIYSNECQQRGYNLQTFSYLFSVAKVFDIHGYSLFINNACASGLFAIESASMQIRAGVSPIVIVAAVDNPTKIYKYLWFKKKGLYADDGLIKPFSEDSNGTVFGDGGAALVMEDLEYAQKRGAKIYAEYLGGGFSLEGWKVTVPNPTSDFYTRSFKKALKIAKTRPQEIDFINPHGIGLRITDTYEARTISNIFGNARPMVSAFKPLVGHNLGGSGLLETAIALLSMKNDLIPATLNCTNTPMDLDIVKRHTRRKLNKIAKMSCGFAGFNGVAIFSKFKR